MYSVATQRYKEGPCCSHSNFKIVTWIGEVVLRALTCDKQLSYKMTASPDHWNEIGHSRQTNKQTTKKKLKSLLKFLIFRNMNKLFKTPWKTLRSPFTNCGLSVFQIFRGNEVQSKTKHLANKQKFFKKIHNLNFINVKITTSFYGQSLPEVFQHRI